MNLGAQSGLDMKAFEINIHKNAFLQTPLSFMELCLGFHNKIFKIFHPLSMELLKGLVRYEAKMNSPVFSTQVIHCLRVSQNVSPSSFGMHFPMRVLGKCKLQKHRGKWFTLWHFVSLSAGSDEQRENRQDMSRKRERINWQIKNLVNMLLTLSNNCNIKGMLLPPYTP